MIVNELANDITHCLINLYRTTAIPQKITLQKTRKGFQGHLTFVVFPFLKMSKKSAEVTAHELGDALLKSCPDMVENYQVVKGFLNISIQPKQWINELLVINDIPNYGFTPPPPNAPLVMIEYSSPNTNKPLHLGHVRNNLLGYSLAEILKANGTRVLKTNLVNDRGIHICKSMIAWQKWGNNVTPASAQKKGDHLVGDFYVMFDKFYKQELLQLQQQGLDKDDAEAKSKLMEETRNMLRLWEAGDPTTIQLWEKMNQWVYDGFDKTYQQLGVDFDKIYYESQTYLEGKQTILHGLEQGIFVKHDDGSVWADLTNEGLDEKILLRSDGTSVYITQDVGTAKVRFQDFNVSKMIYVVGNEQNYHFQVLAILLDKLGLLQGKNLLHFSYGMVELPDGKMKSREGTVVDADDLMEEMIQTAQKISNELGKLDGLSHEQAEDTVRKIGLGALKYFILKVDPKKNMVFDPAESIDFNGNTGPFIQYTYARIQSILRKATDELNIDYQAINHLDAVPSEQEMNLIQAVSYFKNVVNEAAENFSPACVANYVYELTKDYNRFYHDHSILGKDVDHNVKLLRITISNNVAKIIHAALALLGIDTPDRM